MMFGSVIIGIFSLVILFYTNSFLMKRRRREFGLYNILGMEKRHIAWVMFFLKRCLQASAPLRWAF